MTSQYYFIAIHDCGPHISPPYATEETRQDASDEYVSVNVLDTMDDLYFLDLPDGNIYSMEIPAIEEDDGQGDYECTECGSTYHPSGACPNKIEFEEEEADE